MSTPPPIAPPPAPGNPLVAPLGRTDAQVLMGLRIALAAVIVLTFASMALYVVNVGRYGAAVAIQLVLRNILGMLPPAAVLVAMSVRTPPAGIALDAAAGLGIASLLFRFAMFGVSGLIMRGADQPLSALSALLLWMVTFSALDAAIAGLALYLRSRIGFHVGALIVATLGFLLYDGLVQAVMQVLTSLLF